MFLVLCQSLRIWNANNIHIYYSHVCIIWFVKKWYISWVHQTFLNTFEADYMPPTRLILAWDIAFQFKKEGMQILISTCIRLDYPPLKKYVPKNKSVGEKNHKEKIFLAMYHVEYSLLPSDLTHYYNLTGVECMQLSWTTCVSWLAIWWSVLYSSFSPEPLPNWK